MYSMQSVSLLT